jgi:hypothetical protein
VPHPHGKCNRVELTHSEKHWFWMLVVIMTAQIDFHFTRFCPFTLLIYFVASSEERAKDGFPA